jgi:hypothetical protein
VVGPERSLTRLREVARNPQGTPPSA